MKKSTILVPLESYLYLQQKCHEERSETGRPLSEQTIERLKRSFNSLSYNGYYRLMDGDLGGCNGSPKNAYEERRWTSWSCEDMKRILSEAGLPCKDGEATETISL